MPTFGTTFELTEIQGTPTRKRKVMSVVKTIVLICDCDQVMIDVKGEFEPEKIPLARICHKEVDGYNVNEVREKAKNAGWGYVKPKGMRTSVDLCPIHLSAYEENKAEEDKRAKDPTVKALRAMSDPDSITLARIQIENKVDSQDNPLLGLAKPKSHKKKVRVDDFYEAS